MVWRRSERRVWWPLAESGRSAADLRPLAGAVRASLRQFFARLDASQEVLQRMRTAYVWVSSWPAVDFAHHLVMLAIFVLALWAACAKRWARIWRHHASRVSGGGRSERPSFLALLLEQARWGLIPQLQPMRALLFLTLGVQFLTAAAGARAMGERRMPEAFVWFTVAYLIPMQALWTASVLEGHADRRGAGRWQGRRRCWGLRSTWLPAAAAVKWRCFAIPAVGGVVNYPDLHSEDLKAELSAWARAIRRRRTRCSCSPT